MLTQAPLPSWLNYCRALLLRLPSDVDLLASWCREGEVAGWLSRSAWSLALIALWRKSRAPALPFTVWIPDFFCNSSLTALRQTGARLVFYPLTDRMTTDIAACRMLADSAPPDLFVLVHYFGQPSPVAAVRDFCAFHGAWLIEDATHVLRPVDGIGAYGDFVLYSPHKHLPIPDGAVLVLRANGPSQFCEAGFASFGPPSNWPGQLRELQQELGCSVNSGWVHAIVWLVKRLLQKLGPRFRPQSTTSFPEPLNLGPTVDTHLNAPSQSSLARRLLAGLVCDLGAVARQRQRHQLIWDALLIDDAASCKDILSAAERSINLEWTPYLAAYRVGTATAEATHDQWRRRGLPVSTWPDLPPEVTAHRERHVNAWQLRHSRLYLPVHQSLSVREIMGLCRLPKAVKESDVCLTLVWDGATQVQWQQWMAQAGRSNLMQSWAYGGAKSDLSGWRVKRGVFYCDSQPIAIVQMLQKSVAGLLSVSRINRGPLFLRTLQSKEQRAVWEELARLGSLWQGRFLTLAPELGLSGSSLTLMEDIGFRQSSRRALESVWVSLGLELDALRIRLNGKWRNMLTASEKSALKLEISSGDQFFDWMMARYQELMKEKDFCGPSIDLLLALREHLVEDAQLLILQAVHEGEPVAGICLARHGTAATYLLGWNGNKGRHLKANQYLLWQAVMHLKQSGLSWFDLGGISEEHTPGITAFKLGLNGERYELVGEYWKW